MMLIATTILVALLAILDLILTDKSRRYGAHEGHPIPKFLWKLFGRKAWIPHAILYAGFISLPWLFPTAGHVTGNLLLSAFLVYAANKNYEIIERNKW